MLKGSASRLEGGSLESGAKVQSKIKNQTIATEKGVSKD